MTPFGLPTHTNTNTYYTTSTKGHYSILQTIKQSIDIITSDRDSKRICYFLLLNMSYMFIQLAYGIWTNSLGLISDAIHMFFDCLALSIGLFAAVMSQWPVNDEFTYGYDRIETLAAYFNGVFLVFISLSIITEAIQRLIKPPEMTTHHLLIVSVIGLMVNLVGIFAFQHGHNHSHSHHGHNQSHGHHANMKGVFLHMVADTLGSCGVIVSTLLIQRFGWTGFDPIASLFIAVLIIISVIPLIRQATEVMMLELDDDKVAMVEGTLQEVKSLYGVYNVTHIRFWPYETDSIVGSIHVQVQDDIDTQAMRKAVTDLLQTHISGLKELCVQIELYSAIKRNRSAVSQKGFFHTPMYGGISSTNNAHVNYRPISLSTPPIQYTDNNMNNRPQTMMSVLQKQTKKE